jgi:hypothetical protein
MKKTTFAILTCILFSSFLMQTFNTYAQRHQSIGNLTKTTQIDKGLILETNFGKLQILVIAPEIIRIRATKTEFETDFSYAVSLIPEKISFDVKDETEKIILTTSMLSVEITKNPVRIKFLGKKNVTPLQPLRLKTAIAFCS